MAYEGNFRMFLQDFVKALYPQIIDAMLKMKQDGNIELRRHFRHHGQFD